MISGRRDQALGLQHKHGKDQGAVVTQYDGTRACLQHMHEPAWLGSFVLLGMAIKAALKREMQYVGLLGI